jgi:hypothetical protein
METVINTNFFTIYRQARVCHSLPLLLRMLIASFALAGNVHAAVLYVPNGSFEAPATTNVDIRIDAWQDQPQSPFFDPSQFGGQPWATLMGRFANTDPGSFDHLDNLDGTQAAYIFTFPGAGFFQDFNSVDWTGNASHAFNPTFEVGRSYHLTTAFTSSSNEPLTNGASIEMSLYYHGGSNQVVKVAATNVVFDTKIFTNLDHLIDFTLDVTTVQATDAWAGRNIGIEFISTTFDSNLITGVWDLDNVRLSSTITVPNGSFETPPTTNVDVRIDSWQDNPQSPFFDPSQFGGQPWATLMGRFANTDPGSFDHLDNLDGTQAAYVFTFPGAGFFQDFDSTDWSNTVPTHAFNVKMQPGRSYTLTAAFTSSSNEPLTNGASLQMALYYGAGPTNMTVLAANNVVFDAKVFTNLDHLVDFQATIPEVKATDPWAGKNIGIEFISTTFDPNLITGVWDLDNVRLTERVATLLSNPAVTNGQVSFTLQSEPGSVLELLASTNLASLSSGWTSVSTLTNLTGSFLFTDTATNQQRFYRVRQLP